MASWKLCAVLLLCVLLALVSQSESRRGGGRSRSHTHNSGLSRADGDEDMEADTATGNGVSRLGRRRGASRRWNAQSTADRDTEGTDSDDITGPDLDNAAPGRRGGRGRGRGNGSRRGGRKGGRRGGRRGGGDRQPGGSRRGGGRRRVISEERLALLLNNLSDSMEDFGLDVYSELARTNRDNFVFSPFSVYTAMSQVLLGASGRTKRELKFGLKLRGAVHRSLKAYNDSLDEEDDEDTVLSVANRIYTVQDLPLNPRFVTKLRRFYESHVENFAAEDPEDAINTWVEEKTMGEISNFLEDGAITPETIVMLINAVYFKGSWKDQFDSALTTTRPFQVTPTESVQVETMSRQGRYRIQHSSSLGASVLELPYEGDRFSMFIISPGPETSLSQLESTLTPASLNETLSADIFPNSINLEMPKFSLDTEEDMASVLQTMGVRDLFNKRRCKLRKMTNVRNAFVNKVKHRAVIDVDEEGTVAAAATGVQITLTSLPMPVQINRPFMFVIRDKEQSINLFMGRYVNPEGENLAA